MSKDLTKVKESAKLEFEWRMFQAEKMALSRGTLGTFKKKQGSLYWEQRVLSREEMRGGQTLTGCQEGTSSGETLWAFVETLAFT